MDTTAYRLCPCDITFFTIQHQFFVQVLIEPDFHINVFRVFRFRPSRFRRHSAPHFLSSDNTNILYGTQNVNTNFKIFFQPAGQNENRRSFSAGILSFSLDFPVLPAILKIERALRKRPAFRCHKKMTVEAANFGRSFLFANLNDQTGKSDENHNERKNLRPCNHRITSFSGSADRLLPPCSARHLSMAFSF